MQEIRLKTHLVITNIHDEYFVKWNGSIANCNPLFKNDMPIFVIIGSEARMELNTINIKHIEECAKRMTRPRGRQAITSDTVFIYIKEENGHEKLIGKVEHNRIKEYRPVYDKFEVV